MRNFRDPQAGRLVQRGCPHGRAAHRGSFHEEGEIFPHSELTDLLGPLEEGGGILLDTEGLTVGILR